MKSLIKLLLVLMLSLNIANATLSDGESTKLTVIENDFTFLKTQGFIPESSELDIYYMTSKAYTENSGKIAVSIELGNYSREARIFILLHEASHAKNKHGDKMVALMKTVVSPYVTRFQNINTLKTSRFIKKLSHEHEFVADMEAKEAMMKMGLDPIKGIKEALGDTDESFTHPSFKARVEALN